MPNEIQKLDSIFLCFQRAEKSPLYLFGEIISENYRIKTSIKILLESFLLLSQFLLHLQFFLVLLISL